MIYNAMWVSGVQQSDLSWICFRTRESDETEVNKKLQCHSVMSALRQAMLANAVAC